MPHRKNFLLDRLDLELFDRLLPHLTIAELQHGEVLAENHQQVEKVYFPHTGIISCVVGLVGGGAIETGMIGNDGAFGGAHSRVERSKSDRERMFILWNAPTLKWTTFRICGKTIAWVRRND